MRKYLLLAMLLFIGCKQVIQTEIVSSNCNLLSLTISSGTLEPSFSPECMNYTLSVENSLTTLTVDATAVDPKASVSISPASPIEISPGEQIITVIVVAEDETTQTYSINVTHEEIPLYSIVFHSNASEAEGEMADQVVAQNDRIDLSPCSYSLRDYSFMGWSLTSDGEVLYTDKASFTMGESLVDLYAVWYPEEAIRISILNSDSTDLNPSFNSRIAMGYSLSISVPDIYNSYQWYLNGEILTGKTEPSWNLDTGEYNLSAGSYELALFATDDQGNEYSGSSYFSVTTEIPLILDGNGGTDSQGSSRYQQFHTADKTINLETCPFSREGYTFIGWSRSLSGPTEYAENGSCTPTEGDILYARWISATAAPSADFLTSLRDNEIQLVKYIGSDSQVEIPRMAQKGGLYYPVTAMRETTSPSRGVFAGNEEITELKIPEEIIDFGNYAFYGCTALTQINVEEGNPNYTSEEGVLFNKDQSLLLQYPCSKEGENYTIPESVLTIRESAFEGNGNLVSLSCAGDLQTIEACAFSGSVSLTTIDLPDSVSAIGEGAFSICPALTTISFPDSTTVISDYLFCGSTSLTSLLLPDTIQSIGTEAFGGCSSLESVAIPALTTVIKDRTFSGCSSLTSVSLHEGITAIGEYAFSSCTSLESITLPDSITTIGAFSFFACSRLGSVNIPAAVKNIGNNAFCNCGSISTVTLPSTLTSLGNYVFTNCFKLTSIEVDNSNSFYSSIDGVLFNKYQTTLIQYPPGKTSESYSLPDGVTTIGLFALGSCPALTTLTLPGSLTNTEMYAFGNNSSLTTLTSYALTPPSLGTNALLNASADLVIKVPSESLTSYQEAAGWSDYAAIITAIE